MCDNLEIKDERWGHLKNMVDTYFGSDPSNDQPLWERLETVKADNDTAYIATVLADIADVLRNANDDLDAIYEAELRSYYRPAGDGLTPRQWLTQIAEILAAPPDTNSDHRSGYFGPQTSEDSSL
jgi:hypothetical protein